jgi:putative DNA primase/helicase
MKTLLDHALAYARLGWAIHPLRPGGKRPLLQNWPRRASTDPATIRRWWAQTPQANIGLCAGPSGLVIADLDVKNGFDGLRAWAALAVDGATVTSQTPSGGRHLLYAAPGTGLRNRRKLQDGIEILAGRSNAVLPPSVLSNGEAYRWLRSPETTPVAEFPTALLERLAGSARSAPTPGPLSDRVGQVAGMPAFSAGYGLKALDEEADAVRRAAPGGRNERLNTAAFRLGRLVGAGRLEESRARGRLWEAAREAGLGEREAQATIQSGLEAGKAEPRGGAQDASPRRRAGSPRRDGSARGEAAGAPPAERPSPSGRQPEPRRKGAAEPSRPSPAEQEARERSDGEGEPGGGPPVQAPLAAYEPNDEGNAQAVNALYGDHFRHCEALGWLAWTGTHWARDDAEKRLDRAIVDTLHERRAAAAALENEAVLRAARTTAANVRYAKYLFASIRYVSVNDLDRSPDHLNVQNGRLDLRSGELEPHRPEHGFTYCLPLAYHAEADYREWEDWVVQAVGGDRAVAFFLQQGIGYSLTGQTWEECLFYIYGPPRAGKGLFAETIMAMMGRRPLADEIEFKSLVRSREHDPNSADLAALKPCRLVFASESERGDRLNAAKLKSLTGGNLVQCAYKYRDFFSYRPQFAIWLTSNYPPNLDVDDDAAWSRIRAIHFPNSYLGREDRSLKPYWRQPAQLEQVLTWAVQGAMTWYQTGKQGMVVPPAVEAATSEARAQLDYVAHWLEECAERTGREDDFVSNAALHQSYEAWCAANGVMAKGQTALTQALKRKGFDAGVVRRVQGKACRGVVGLRMKLLHVTLGYSE